MHGDAIQKPARSTVRSVGAPNVLAFLHQHPLCVECERHDLIRPASVVDHIDPHGGDEAVFWDISRWQALCASCHGKKTASQDGGFGNAKRCS